MQYTQLSRRSAGGKMDWEKQYLTFIPVEDAVFSWTQRATSGHLEYSVNGGQTWVTIADGESTPTITAGSKVIWRGDLKPNTNNSDGGIGTFSASGNYNAYGNTMSLLNYNNYYGSHLQSNYPFRRLFYNDTHILSTPLLPAITLVYNCYNEMFCGCTSLTKAPELPATTLANGCYNGMFYGCTSLTTAPTVLPATTLTPFCYRSMFQGCTSLTTAPNLPATTLANYCYQSMFYGCTSLTTAPTVLPATTLTDFCYTEMFYGCTSLTTAPDLPATTLASFCYRNMFRGCTSLTTAPTVLPATTLATSCYSMMFYGCTSLTTAPELPATTLINDCYRNMFQGCGNLNYIKCLATDISATNCTSNWLLGVAATGTFVKVAGMEDWTTGASGIPSGWTVVDDNSFVDMGLPSGTLWATRNIDVTQPDGFAASPYQYECSFFSWGNIDGHNPISASKFDYDWGGMNSQEPYYEGQPYGDTPGSTLTTNIPVNDTYDAARANLGAPWRIPTIAEYVELYNNIKFINADGTEIPSTTTDKRVIVNGVMGIYLQSKLNGQKLFFACTGVGENQLWKYRDLFGNYWNSAKYSSRYARYFYFTTNNTSPNGITNRCLGFAIRPVI